MADRDALLYIAEQFDMLKKERERRNMPAWIQLGITVVTLCGFAMVMWWRIDRLEADRERDRLEWIQTARELKAATAQSVSALRGHELGCDGLHPRRGVCGGVYGGGREGAP